MLNEEDVMAAMLAKTVNGNLAFMDRNTTSRPTHQSGPAVDMNKFLAPILAGTNVQPKSNNIDPNKFMEITERLVNSGAPLPMEFQEPHQQPIQHIPPAQPNINFPTMSGGSIPVNVYLERIAVALETIVSIFEKKKKKRKSKPKQHAAQKAPLISGIPDPVTSDTNLNTSNFNLDKNSDQHSIS